MEMPSSQWWSELEMEDLDVGQCNDELTEPTEEELEALNIGYHNNFDYESDMFLTGYPSNVKLPATVDCHWGIGSSRGCVSYERLRKQSRVNTLVSSNNDQQPLIFTPPSIYVPNSQQKLQHQQRENYFASFFQRIANETDHIKHPATRNPSMEAEIVPYGGHAHNCNSDSAFNVCSRQLLRKKLGPSDTQISNVSTAGNGLTRNQLESKASSQNKDHIMAERKRREKVSQRFIALSSILPELKKTDKASILGEAIKYMQLLQDRIKELEEQAPKTTPHSVLFVKKTELSAHHQDTDKAISYSSTNSSFEIKNSYTSSDKVVTEGVLLTPEIEIRVVDRNVIIRIHCEMEKGLLLKSFAELEKLQLTVVNASVLSFSGSTMDLIFNVQMEEGCHLTMKDIDKAVQALFKK